MRASIAMFLLLAFSVLATPYLSEQQPDTGWGRTTGLVVHVRETIMANQLPTVVPHVLSVPHRVILDAAAAAAAAAVAVHGLEATTTPHTQLAATSARDAATSHQLPIVMSSSTAASSRRLHGIVLCTLNRTRYHPSELEHTWAQQVQRLAGSSTPVTTEQYCSYINSSLTEFRHWLSAVKRLMATTAALRLQPAELKSFSRFTRTYHCGKARHTISAPIEPLAGVLRHPLALCPTIGRSPTASLKRRADVDQLFLQSKLHVLMAPAYLQLGFQPPDVKVFMFDVGANLWSTGRNGTTSQRWFVDALQRRGYVLDEYYGWEETSYYDKGVFAKVPLSLYAKYHYYNVRPSTDLRSSLNPLNMMRAVASFDDHVLLRLNVGDAATNMLFVQQLLGNLRISSLVDELFLELPGLSYAKPVRGDSAQMGPRLDMQNISDAYDIITQLRQRGIRAHNRV